MSEPEKSKCSAVLPEIKACCGPNDDQAADLSPCSLSCLKSTCYLVAHCFYFAALNSLSSRS